MSHKFNYRWTLKDAVFTKDKGNVFSWKYYYLEPIRTMMAQVASRIWEQWISKL